MFHRSNYDQLARQLYIHSIPVTVIMEQTSNCAVIFNCELQVEKKVQELSSVQTFTQSH